MKPTLVTLAFAILAVGLVSAQITPPSSTYDKPQDREYDPGLCHSKMVTALYRATDVADPSQEKHLKAAEAYRLLDLAGQRCP